MGDQDLVYKRIAVRAIQVDYLMGSNLRGSEEFKLHNAKFSFGVVFRLGGK